MELEIKQILNHVINGCKIKILNYKCDYVGIQYAKSNGYYFIGTDIFITYDGGSAGKSIKDFSLILHPLSDLTKEIEVNGEKFVAIENFTKDLHEDIKTCLIDNTYYELLPYFIVEKLLEWNFDIYGLIENDLAIDINTLKQ